MQASNPTHARAVESASLSSTPLCTRWMLRLARAFESWIGNSPDLTDADIAVNAPARVGKRGHVSLVGAGPGAVDLLTVRALRRIEAADAVVYDRLVGAEILALLPRGCERYYVGKARGDHSVPQAEIGALMVRLANEGKRVVRLKGGDPGIFGRMGEELAALDEAGIGADIVPGITAAAGAVAAMGMPLTDRAHAQQVRFVTAQQCRDDAMPDFSSLARRDETLVFYMGLNRLETICQGLRDAGLPSDWPVMLIANASLSEQRSLIGTLVDMPAKLAANPLPSPCLIVVGSVVAMAHPQVSVATALDANL